MHEAGGGVCQEPFPLLYIGSVRAHHSLQWVRFSAWLGSVCCLQQRETWRTQARSKRWFDAG